ncbi:MAG: hypothetical protein Q4G69_04125 [Planctomycetia bacterium]|nr:hypothetical protein [Planctomycetia bacterium]
METIIAGDPVIAEGNERSQRFFDRPDARDYIEAAEKRYRDEQAIRLTLTNEALKKGMEKGLCDALCSVLNVRFAKLSESIASKIKEKSKPEQERLLLLASTCASMENFKKEF